MAKGRARGGGHEELQPFADFVRERRRALGLNQVELADRIGVHSTRISVWERALEGPDLASIAALASALEVPETDLSRRLDPWRARQGRVVPERGPPETSLEDDEKEVLSLYAALSPTDRARALAALRAPERLADADEGQILSIYRALSEAAKRLARDALRAIFLRTGSPDVRTALTLMEPAERARLEEIGARLVEP